MDIIDRNKPHQIGIYEVLGEIDRKTNDGHKLYHIRCSICGWETDIMYHHIKLLNPECHHTNVAGQYIDTFKKFPWKNNRLKNIYQGIIQRCYNPNEKSYRWYGAKGIKVCEEWLKNPLSFEEWALSNGYMDELTIDRIEEDKDYCPENCWWISRKNNARYKSTTRVLEVDGVLHTGREWAEEVNLGINTINKMLSKYPQEQVKEFIRRRLKNPNAYRRSHQTWMNVYDLED